VNWAPVILGAVLGVVMGYVLAGGEPIVAPIIAIIGAIAILTTKYAKDRKAKKQGMALYDEMHLTLATRSGYTALRASMLTVALIIVITVWHKFFNIDILPPEVAEKLFPGLGLSFAIMAIAYLTAYTLLLEV